MDWRIVLFFSSLYSMYLLRAFRNTNNGMVGGRIAVICPSYPECYSLPCPSDYFGIVIHFLAGSGYFL